MENLQGPCTTSMKNTVDVATVEKQMRITNLVSKCCSLHSVREKQTN